MKQTINTENAPKPVGPYSQAVKAGNFLFISGQLAIDPKTGKIDVSDVRGQTERVMENIKAILAAAGYGLECIVQTNVYLTSLNTFSDFNSVYAKYFGEDFPTRVTAGTILMQGALVEISAIAYCEKR